MIILSLILNLIICYIIFFKMPKIEISHLFIVSISVSDIVQILVGLIPEMLMTVRVHPIKKDLVCIGSGSLTYALAVVNIMHLTVVSIIRAIGIKCPVFYYKNCKNRSYKVLSITFCYAYGFIWALFPLIGWSKYEIDVDYHRCSLDWKFSRKDTLSYVLAVEIFCFILPGLVITIALILSNKSSSGRKFQMKATPHLTKLLEKVYLKIFTLSAIAFFVFWTPYAFVTLLTMLEIKVPTYLFSISAFCAKLSSITNGVVNCYVNKSFRNHLYKLSFFRYLKRNRTVEGWPRVN